MSVSSIYFSRSEIKKMFGWSDSALRNNINHNGFPAPVKYSFDGKAPTRTTKARYIQNEVLAWKREKEEEANLIRKNYVSPESDPETVSRPIDTIRVLWGLQWIWSLVDKNREAWKIVHRGMETPEELKRLEELALSFKMPVTVCATHLGLKIPS